MSEGGYEGSGKVVEESQLGQNSDEYGEVNGGFGGRMGIVIVCNDVFD